MEHPVFLWYLEKSVGKIELEDYIELKENNCYSWLAAAQGFIRDWIPPIFVVLKFPSKPFLSWHFINMEKQQLLAELIIQVV